MTPKTKLEPIGLYTPEHEGPFCTRDGRSARVICVDKKGDNYPVVTLVEKDGIETICRYGKGGEHKLGMRLSADLMNAREVPVAREFWINEYAGGSFGRLHDSALEAAKTGINSTLIRTIHVREVLPGESA